VMFLMPRCRPCSLDRQQTSLRPQNCGLAPPRRSWLGHRPLPLAVSAVILCAGDTPERGHTVTDAWMVQLPGCGRSHRLRPDSISPRRSPAFFWGKTGQPRALRRPERTVGNRTVEGRRSAPHRQRARGREPLGSAGGTATSRPGARPPLRRREHRQARTVPARNRRNKPASNAPLHALTPSCEAPCCSSPSRSSASSPTQLSPRSQGQPIQLAH